jgi:hypothetical protein
VSAPAARNSQLETGRLILNGLPAIRSHLLAHWTSGGVRLNGLSRWLFDGLVRALDAQYYSSESSTAVREHLKSLCMADGSAIYWARQYLAKGFPDATTPFLPMFRRLDEALSQGSVQTVHQVACCSGREIAFYAKKYPGIRFVGSDCDEELVAFLRVRWADLPNLKFVLLRLDEAPSPHDAALQCDLLLASGGFHYLDHPSLTGFFRRAREISLSLFLSQPMDRSFDPESSAGSLPRQMLSWNHPYPRMLEEAGWSAVTYEEGFIQELPKLKNFAAFAGTAPLPVRGN